MRVLPSASGAFGEWVVHLACLGVLGANPVTLASDLTSGALIRQVRCKGYRRCAKRTKAGKVHHPFTKDTSGSRRRWQDVHKSKVLTVHQML